MAVSCAVVLVIAAGAVASFRVIFSHASTVPTLDVEVDDSTSSAASKTIDSVYVTASPFEGNVTDHNPRSTDSGVSQSMNKCQMMYRDHIQNNLFFIDTYTVPLSLMVYEIQPDKDNHTSCFLSRSDITSRMNKSEGPPIIALFHFACSVPGTEIVFLEVEEVDELFSGADGNGSARQIERDAEAKYPYYARYISYFESQDCKTSFRGVWMVANMTDLRVLTGFGNESLDLQELQHNPELCDAFRNLVAFDALNDWAITDQLPLLAICNGSLDNVVEVILANASIKSFPEFFRTVMPNLRALELSNNNLTSPVEFPWQPGFAVLPRNLSRTYQFNSAYSLYGAIDMQPNLFRRVYILNGNNITNLTHFRFYSDFQHVSIERNNMSEIGEEVFYDISDLQFLSLARNALEILPERLFSRLQKLKRLDLQENRLRTLPQGLFKNLWRLEKLNLEGNMLEVLHDGLFTNLEQLTDVRLKGNNLVQVSDGAFSTLSVKLSSLDLSDNPLKEIPTIVFHLRGLVDTKLESTDIELLDFVQIDNRTSASYMLQNLRNPTTGEFVDLAQTPDYQRFVSLKNSRLQSIVLYNDSRETIATFLLLAKYFTFQLDGTRLECDCNILNVTHIVAQLRREGKLNGEEALFKGWVCAWPDELSEDRRTVASLSDNETYCPLVENLGPGEQSQCPDRCKCYVRTGVNTTIVDCQHMGLTSFPEFVPDFTQELWLQNNTIKTIEGELPYLAELHTLKLSANNLQDVPLNVIRKLTSMRVLYLDNNWLTALLPDLGELPTLQTVRLDRNPFRCDCNTLWLKRWVLGSQVKVEDWKTIKCSLDKDEGQLITAVPDENFVCIVPASLTQLAVPIAVPVSFALLLLAFLLVAFICRRQLKVHLYIYTGLHPFDRDPPDQRYRYDVTVCCTDGDQEWVLTNVISVLEVERGYRLFFLNRDAFLGFSLTDNVRHCVKNSRRLVAILGRGWNNEEMLVAAVRQGLAKSQKDMVHFLTLVLHDVPARDVKDKDLQQMIRKGRFLCTSESHFLKKLAYEMPHLKTTAKGQAGHGKGKKTDSQVVELHDIIAIADNQHNAILENGPVGCRLRTYRVLSENSDESVVGGTGSGSEDMPREERAEEEKAFNDKLADGEFPAGVEQKSEALAEKSVFVWYADVDLAYAVESVVRPLEGKGHHCVLQDRDFALGAAIQENIVCAADTCARAVFVLSDDTAASEWFLFAFHVVVDRSLQHPDRCVLLLLRDALHAERLTDEVQQAVRMSAVLRERDPWFAARLQQFVELDFKDIV